MSVEIEIETYRGVVYPWQMDHMGHMNVMWYTHFFDRAIWGFYELFDFGTEYHTNSGFGSFGLEMYTRLLSFFRLAAAFDIYVHIKRS